MNEHVPVMMQEVIKYLDLAADQQMVDCTVGGGGHAARLLRETAPDGMLLGLDWDQEALTVAQEALTPCRDRVTLVAASYTQIQEVVTEQQFGPVYGVLCDLGLSSNQLADIKRGFSFKSHGKLDMRFDEGRGETAYEMLMTYPAADLIRIFKEYGEERLAVNITRQIVEKRKEIEITGEVLREICEQQYKRAYRRPSATHPATRVWQALRIAVNNEFENIREFLPKAIEVLEPGGRLVVITFHSLEDRIVKQYFKKEATDCLCPPESPVCQCGHTATIKLITGKAVKPDKEEVKANPRARSALLRAVEKL